MAFAQSTQYTKMGMNAAQGTPVIHRTEKGGDFYYKSFEKFPANVQNKMYQAFEKLRSLGVGIQFTRTANGVRMVAGIPLPRAFKKGMITKAMKDKMIGKVQDIQRKLRRARWAHTAVKSANLVIQKRSETDFDVYLIDNDFAASFGEQRLVYTPGVNGVSQDGRDTINEHTDTMGFQSVIQDINSSSLDSSCSIS